MAEIDRALAQQILEMGCSLGFDLVATIPARPARTSGHYEAWLERDYHGQMAYLARPGAVANRADLAQILEGVQAVVTVAANYHTHRLPEELRDDPSRGVVASYAWGDDYHDVLTSRMHQLAAFVERERGRLVVHRAYVDTGPILERELAALAGLGFIGKNTCLIHPRLGSWLFLGELLLDITLPSTGSAVCVGQLAFSLGDTSGAAGDSGWRQHRSRQETARGFSPGRGTGVANRATLASEGQQGATGTRTRPAGAAAAALAPLLRGGTCGQCNRCLDACPTGALLEPYLLDARRCISYLTIELKGSIPRDLRPLVGNRIFGCDICQEVCPWNRRFAQPTAEPAFQPRPDSIAPHLLDLMTLDENGFRRRFRHSPLQRTRRRGLLRNAAVALGNWGAATAVPALACAMADHESLIRGHAAWALGRIGTPEAWTALEQALDIETDEWVRQELRLALESGG